MANINRVQVNGTNRTKSTISFWIKRCKLGVDQKVFQFKAGSAEYLMKFKSNDQVNVYSYDGSSYIGRIETNRMFRDPAAWYHFHIQVDTTDSTAGNRFRFYVNGQLEGNLLNSNVPSQNASFDLSTSSHHLYVGSQSSGGDAFSGLITHFHYTDGYSYAPTVFGSTDATSGIWSINTSPSVTYGTNGLFWLKDSVATTDHSPNSNTFTLVGTLTKTEDNPDNNFPTLNPLVPGAKTPTYGNLHIEALYASWKCNTATFGLTKGKWYYEFKLNQLTNYAQIGIVSEFDMAMQNNYWGNAGRGWGYNSGTGEYYNNGSGNSYGNSYTASNYMACAMDLDNNKLYFAKDNTWQNSGVPTSGSTGTGAISISQQANYDLWFPAFSINYCGVDANFGNGYFGTSVAGTNQDANGIGQFKYTPPSGYFSINTKNLKEFG
tara:strand:- start:434 stop:1735 length:1302 start_codon:yes stop_codon:yes gene_type:complete